MPASWTRTSTVHGDALYTGFGAGLGFGLGLGCGFGAGAEEVLGFGADFFTTGFGAGAGLVDEDGRPAKTWVT